MAEKRVGWPRFNGKTWAMRAKVLVDFSEGSLGLNDTIMVITPEGKETRTVFEWLRDWFPSIGTIQDIKKPPPLRNREGE